MTTSHAQIPEIAVVIPCHNYARFLGQAIDSVLAQSLPAHEIVVVDDGSTDDTPAVCERYPTVKYLAQSNLGPAGARNAGIRSSTSSRILFLDADDLLAPSALESLAAADGRLDERFAGVFGSAQLFQDVAPTQIEATPDRADVEPYVECWLTPQLAVLSTEFLVRSVRSNIIPACTALLRRDVLSDIGLWNERYRSVEDRDLWMRILSRYRIAWLSGEVARIRRHGNNTTHPANWMRNRQQVLTILDDASRADWATAQMRRLVRRQYAIGAHYLAQRLVDSQQYAAACRWLWSSLARSPVQPTVWARLVHCSACLALHRLRGE